MSRKNPYGLIKVGRVWFFKVLRSGGGNYLKSTKKTTYDEALRFVEDNHFDEAWDGGPTSHVHAPDRGLAAKRFAMEPGNNQCHVCGWTPPSEHPLLKGTKRRCHVHHIQPIAMGGDNSDGNLVSLCPNHHYIAHRLSDPLSVQDKGHLIAILREIDASAA